MVKKDVKKKKTSKAKTKPSKAKTTMAIRGRKPEYPKIITFACNWCSYAGADLAGVSRFQYPPSLRVIRVMCAGRITPAFILDALTSGADGVIVSGCHFEDCHYISGSRKAEKIIKTTKKLMHLLGMDERRLRFELISAAEGQKFATVAREFTKEIQDITIKNNGEK